MRLSEFESVDIVLDILEFRGCCMTDKEQAFRYFFDTELQQKIENEIKKLFRGNPPCSPHKIDLSMKRITLHPNQIIGLHLQGTKLIGYQEVEIVLVFRVECDVQRIMDAEALGDR